MKNRAVVKKVTCQYCNGDGEIFDSRKVRSYSPDPPMSKCPVCWGKGVHIEGIEDDYAGMSLSEIEEMEREHYLEEKWERMNDR